MQRNDLVDLRGMHLNRLTLAGHDNGALVRTLRTRRTKVQHRNRSHRQINVARLLATNDHMIAARRQAHNDIGTIWPRDGLPHSTGINGLCHNRRPSRRRTAQGRFRSLRPGRRRRAQPRRNRNGEQRTAQLTETSRPHFADIFHCEASPFPNYAMYVF